MAELTEAEIMTFTQIRDRLDEIAEAVRDDDISLDRSLELYEEAVALGLQASDLLEQIDLAEVAAQEDQEEGDPASASEVEGA